MSDFLDCVEMCLQNDEFCFHYDRLTGNHIMSVRNSTGINARVDEASGFFEDELIKFVAFVCDCVWLRIA